MERVYHFFDAMSTKMSTISPLGGGSVLALPSAGAGGKNLSEVDG
jgi:hypothetical protein